MKEHKELEYYLSNGLLIFLLIYYMLILVGGCANSIWIACSLMEKATKALLLQKIFVISISVSGMFCGIQYIKRLYKACISKRINMQPNKLKRIGNFVYFFSRPFFACAFSEIAIFCLLSGLFIVSGSLDYVLNEKFLYLCVIISSVIGFSIGKVLDKFEGMSIEHINNLK